MPDIPSARFGGTGPSVRSDIYIGSMITSGSPHVASDHFGGLTGGRERGREAEEGGYGRDEQGGKRLAMRAGSSVREHV